MPRPPSSTIKKAPLGGKSVQIQRENISEVRKAHGKRGDGDSTWQFHGNPDKKPVPLVDSSTNLFGWRGETKKRIEQSDRVWSAMQAVRRKTIK